ncbi:MAG: glycosyltransferase family 2 protein [Sedimentisphaerales bacterium]|nr:glycosyltransferase family 2 protein [Sedimentisphaerales bacterium]
MKYRDFKARQSVLLAIPVYNERKYISKVLDQARRYTDDIVIIDDGSTDGTKELLVRRSDINLISRPCNKGYGQAIIDAFHFAQACGAQWMITMDCDLQHDPNLIPVFFSAICNDDADIISGSRYLCPISEYSTPPAERRSVNEIITAMVNEKLGLDLTDSFCGFKAYRVSAVARLELTECGYAIPLEFWVQAAYHGLRVREIPVSLIYNDPNRYFGGNLDNVSNRLRHYMEVFEQSMEKVGWCADSSQPCGCLAWHKACNCQS